MDLFSNLLYGFQVTLEPSNLAFCFLGVLFGTLVGVLPGLGPAAAIALLLPATYKLSPVPAIIMLAGIFYGAMYGGSTTSILVNIPGEASSVVTCLDGYQMARKGRAGPALGISAIGSFVAGTISIIILSFSASALASFALKFGPPEYFSIIVMALIVVTYLARGSLTKALVMVSFGLFLSQIGMDVVSGAYRFTFGFLQLSDGIDMVPMVMGLFGISEIFLTFEKETRIQIISAKIRELLPSLDEWKRSIGPIIRGTLVGFFFGVIPGGGTILSSFMSYGVEKRVSKHPEKFGTGMIEGVAGPEAANNAATGGCFVPLLSLGIPSNVMMALLFAALMIHGIQPSPFLVSERPDLFWGVICSMYIGNVMLLILNLPLIPLWVQVLRVPPRILLPLIFLFCIIGSYTINYRALEIYVMILFGVFGYVLKKLEYEAAPLLMAFVLGQMLEQAFRRSLAMSNGSFLIFLNRPISAFCLLVALVLLVTSFTFYYKHYGEKKVSLLDQ